MAHFSEIRLDTKEVIRTIVVGEHQVKENGGHNTPELETWVKSFHPNDPWLTTNVFNGSYPETFWKQTSYNTKGGIHYNQDGTPSNTQEKALRKNYAGPGMIYDPQLDAFYSKKPFPSWILNTNSCYWEAPIDFPSVIIYGDNQRYDIIWDEENQRWLAYTPNPGRQEFVWEPNSKSWIATGR